MSKKKKKDEVRVAAGKKARGKGSSFERLIAQKFTEWTNFPCKRNWGTESQHVGICRGDVIPDYNSLKDMKKNPTMFVVECKKVQGWELSKVLIDQCVMIGNFWGQTLEESKGTNLFPLLILSKNHHAPLCFFTSEFSTFYHEKPRHQMECRLDLTWEGTVHILSLDDFFAEFDYKTLERKFKGRRINP